MGTRDSFIFRVMTQIFGVLNLHFFMGCWGPREFTPNCRWSEYYFPSEEVLFSGANC